MSRYIDADALKKYVDGCEFCNNCRNKKNRCAFDCVLPDFLTSEWERVIDEQPTVDAVPVVRCRDCKYMRESVDGLFKSGYFCERCHITSDMENCDDFYCADGERRTDGK